MKSVALALLFLGSTCLAASKSVVPILSDDVIVAECSELLLGYVVPIHLTLKDSLGREVSFTYRAGGPETPHNDQFIVAAGAQKSGTFLPRGSKDEKALIALIFRAYSNTWGAPDEAALTKPLQFSDDLFVGSKRHGALCILRGIERRKHTNGAKN